MGDTYNQWHTDCPKCHNRDCLTVFEVTLAATGETHYPESRLMSDGFDVGVDDNEMEDQSTEDERVRCDTCGATFFLTELHL